MVKVQEASYTPDPRGPRVKAALTMGNQEVTTTLPVDGSGSDLAQLIDPLTVSVQQVTYASTPTGGDVRVTLKLGDRSFITRLAIGEEDGALLSALNQFLDGICRTFVQQVQSELQSMEAVAPTRGRG